MDGRSQTRRRQSQVHRGFDDQPTDGRAGWFRSWQGPLYWPRATCGATVRATRRDACPLDVGRVSRWASLVQMAPAWSRRWPGKTRGSPACDQMRPGFHLGGGLARTFMPPTQAMSLIKRGATVPARSGRMPAPQASSSAATKVGNRERAGGHRNHCGPGSGEGAARLSFMTGLVRPSGRRPRSAGRGPGRRAR